MEAVHVRMINLYYPIFTYHYLSRMVITHSDVKQPENIYICIIFGLVKIQFSGTLGWVFFCFSSLNSIPWNPELCWTQPATSKAAVARRSPSAAFSANAIPKIRCGDGFKNKDLGDHRFSRLFSVLKKPQFWPIAMCSHSIWGMQWGCNWAYWWHKHGDNLHKLGYDPGKMEFTLCHSNMADWGINALNGGV